MPSTVPGPDTVTSTAVTVITGVGVESPEARMIVAPDSSLNVCPAVAIDETVHEVRAGREVDAAWTSGRLRSLNGAHIVDAPAPSGAEGLDVEDLTAGVLQSRLEGRIRQPGDATCSYVGAVDEDG